MDDSEIDTARLKLLRQLSELRVERRKITDELIPLMRSQPNGFTFFRSMMALVEEQVLFVDKVLQQNKKLKGELACAQLELGFNKAIIELQRTRIEKLVEEKGSQSPWEQIAETRQGRIDWLEKMLAERTQNE